MGFALAFTASSTCCSNLQSQSLLFAAAALRSKPCLSLCNSTYRPKRILQRSPIVGAQSENGALVTSEKPDTNYGRQYFPLAAVVGQVIINNLCFFFPSYCLHQVCCLLWQVLAYLRHSSMWYCLLNITRPTDFSLSILISYGSMINYYLGVNLWKLERYNITFSIEENVTSLCWIII